MNHSNRRSFICLISGAALLAASLPAAASDNLGVRVATEVGRAIAGQGNIALTLIKEELKDNLLQSLKPLLADQKTPADHNVAANHQ